MTKEEAIKYLQQLYPNGGHCWLDEQRIEAIGIAINALQEEPVSEDLEKVCDLLVNCIEDFMARRMEIWDEECKKQTLENLRNALKK